MQTNEELAKAIQNGDGGAVARLWQQCYGFIRKQAIRWANAWDKRNGFDVDDLTQSGYFALCDAIRAFDPERGSFISILDLYLKTEFQKVTGCRTTAQLNSPLNNALSLEAPAYTDVEGNETPFGDTIPVEEPGFEAVEDSIYKAQLKIVVHEALNRLPDRQRAVIDAHYMQGKTYNQIGKMLNVSCTRCGQLVNDGLKKLRQDQHAAVMTKLLWGERNFYMHTGYTAWKESGCSVQERMVEWKEQEEKINRLKRGREYKIKYCVERLGMDRKEAEILFPV